MTSKTKWLLFGTLTGLAAVVALDSVYLLGYRHGMQEERRASTAGHQLTYTIVGLTGRGARTVVNAPDPRAYRDLGHSSP
jgi:hypothetical protein